MDYEASLAKQFSAIGLPEAAASWLIDLWRVVQLLDDAADGDAIGHDRARDAAFAILIRIPANPFWEERKSLLMPILATQILKWIASDDAERAGEADERSFMWRAGYYDVVLATCHLCGLSNVGRQVMAMYGETFTDYRGEFPCQIP